MKLRHTTRMAFQAAVAVAIAELISLYGHVERDYWITLTAMALVTQTWGESVKRSFERVGMTVFGGVVGTILYFILPDRSLYVLLLLLLFVFFTVYLLYINHLWSVFFITCVVVFMFALIGDWNLAILRARIMDTGIGALIALGVGATVFPLKTNILQRFLVHFETIKASFNMMFGASKQIDTSNLSQKLAVALQNLQKDAKALRYEILFYRFNKKDFYTLLNQTALCTEYAIQLLDAYSWVHYHLNETETQSVKQAICITQTNLSILIDSLEGDCEQKMVSTEVMNNCLASAIAASPHRFASLESEALAFYNLMHFFSRVNHGLQSIRHLLV